MELALSLGGDTVSKPFSCLDKKMAANKDLGFCMGLGDGRSSPSSKEADRVRSDDQDHERRVCSSDPPVQLDLLPFSPVHRAQYPPSSQPLFPWLTGARSVLEEAEDGAALSSPNTSTTVSSFQMDFPARNGNNKRDLDQSRALSDDEDNALARKKLRLSKDQSAFLEETFKEHNTLNPKQKIALAKQLNLRPRQIEVWFQNRRARTKLKQTEVDCEYLKKCCETLTEENRRLQKELQELRALKSSQPLFMHLPATTLTMCPSCERVATTTYTTTSSPPLSIAKSPRLVFPYSHAQPQLHQAQAQAQAH